MAMDSVLAARRPFVGVWTLESFTEKTGSSAELDPQGPAPLGFLIYTAEGVVSAQLIRRDRKALGTDPWDAGGADLTKGYIAYCGSYEVHEDRREVIHKPTVSLLPNLSEMLRGEERFPIAIRLRADIRNDPERLRSLQIKTPQGELGRVDQVAEIKTVGGPILINREQTHRRAVVMSKVSERDLGSFVKDCKAAVAAKMPLPPGYRLEWGGQYENQQRTQQRLVIVFPVSLLIISALLYASFQNVRQMFLILSIVPLALVGGVATLWLRGINLNLSACGGFIALFGIAVLNGVVMLSHINSLRKEGKKVEDAVHQGASDRLRPVLITALVASLGFIPMAISTSRAAEVERPLATVVIGGLITATILSLDVLPLMYPWFSKDLEITPAREQA